MAREEKAIFTNLCMVTDARGYILVEDRKDPDWPGSACLAAMRSPGKPLPTQW